MPGRRRRLAAGSWGVEAPGYYRYRNRPLSPTRMRPQWLPGFIREVHAASRGTCGSRRVHAELTLGMRVHVSERLVTVLMSLVGSWGQRGSGVCVSSRPPTTS